MAQTFKGLIQFVDSNEKMTVGIDGDHGNQRIGGNGQDGNPVICNSDGMQVVQADGQAHTLAVGKSLPGSASFVLDGKNGQLIGRDQSNRTVFFFNSQYAALYLGGQGNEGDLIVRDDAKRERIKLDGGEGDIWVKDTAGNILFHFDSQYAALYLGGQGNEGDLVVRNSAGKETIKLDGERGDIILGNADAAEDFEVTNAAEAAEGTVMVLAADGRL